MLVKVNSSINYDYNEQTNSVYYKHDLSAQNANYQREIATCIWICYFMKKNMVIFNC